MLVTRRNQDFMPTLFNELMNWNDTTYSTPRMNIMETKDNYKLELCIPGLTKEDVKLNIDAEGNLVVDVQFHVFLGEARDAEFEFVVVLRLHDVHAGR